MTDQGSLRTAALASGTLLFAVGLAVFFRLVTKDDSIDRPIIMLEGLQLAIAGVVVWAVALSLLSDGFKWVGYAKVALFVLAGISCLLAFGYFGETERWHAVGDRLLVLSAMLTAAGMTARPFHSVSSTHKLAVGAAAVIALLFLGYGVISDGISVSSTVIPAAIVLAGAASRGVGP